MPSYRPKHHAAYIPNGSPHSEKQTILYVETQHLVDCAKFEGNLCDCGALSVIKNEDGITLGTVEARLPNFRRHAVFRRLA